MAPNFEEFPSDFPNYVKRKIEGESYSKLASELDISSGKIVDLMDQYFARVAPLARYMVGLEARTGRRSGAAVQARKRCAG